MSKKAMKLLDRMRQSKAGWRPHDFQTLYLGFGFRLVEGKNHTTYIHADFPQLIDQIPRHDEELSKAYASDAIKLIETLLKLQEEEATDDE